ncbi:MAG: hypothetical protein J0H20_21270, partial [Rhizobiales bacterium]|nr:hypothetical protein [Hyphomicrobiales bacterium]
GTTIAAKVPRSTHPLAASPARAMAAQQRKTTAEHLGSGMETFRSLLERDGRNARGGRPTDRRVINYDRAQPARIGATVIGIPVTLHGQCSA